MAEQNIGQQNSETPPPEPTTTAALVDQQLSKPKNNKDSKSAEEPPSKSNTDNNNHQPPPPPSAPAQLFYQCPKCHLKYLTKLEYILHIRTHHVVQETYKCDLCVKLCSNLPALMRHKIMAHTQPQYICDRCDEEFPNIPDIKKQMYKHIWSDRPQRPHTTISHCMESIKRLKLNAIKIPN